MLDNPIHKTQDKDKQNKNTTQYMLYTTIRQQTQITQIRHESPYKKLEVKILNYDKILKSRSFTNALWVNFKYKKMQMNQFTTNHRVANTEIDYTTHDYKYLAK